MKYRFIYNSTVSVVKIVSRRRVKATIETLTILKHECNESKRQIGYLVHMRRRQRQTQQSPLDNARGTIATRPDPKSSIKTTEDVR